MHAFVQMRIVKFLLSQYTDALPQTYSFILYIFRVKINHKCIYFLNET